VYIPDRLIIGKITATTRHIKVENRGRMNTPEISIYPTSIYPTPQVSSWIYPIPLPFRPFALIQAASIRPKPALSKKRILSPNYLPNNPCASGY
jgi:hypothetical protein